MNKVDHPNYYINGNRKECIVEMEEKYGVMFVINFSLGNAYKYLYRAGNKDDNPKQQDLDKALWYFNYATKLLNEYNAYWLNDLTIYNDIREELIKHELL